MNTTIKLRRKTLLLINSYRENKRETWDDIITKILDSVEEELEEKSK